MPIPLTSHGLLHVHGAQAADLLQAQLTQGLRDLPADAARMAAYCNPQGRMLADFVAWRDAGGGYALLIDAALLEPTARRLRMFILRLQCTVDDFGAQRSLHGMLLDEGDDPGPWPLPAAVWGVERRDGVCAVRLPDAPGQRRVLLVGETDAGRAALAAAAGGDAADWELAGIRAGIAHLGAATAGQFVPQMLNYELLGAVDFGKGCYPGQEIVARTQYRGQVKRRAHRVAAAVEVRPGEEIFDAAAPAEPCGVVVNAAPAGGAGWEALIELRHAAVAADLRAGAVDGPALRLLSLPYTVPEPA